MCFLTNVNVLSPFHIALHTHTHKTWYRIQFVVVFILYLLFFDFRFFHSFFSFSLSISFPVLPLTATSPISLIVFSSFCHQLVCQRNKIYKFSLQSNIKAEVFFCCCLFFSYLSLSLSLSCFGCSSITDIRQFLMYWMVSISMDCNQFDDNNIV